MTRKRDIKSSETVLEIHFGSIGECAIVAKARRRERRGW